ncbi:hypothetical protein IJ670_02015 [bacterium]|nr:hypothetical protein [bacterium]
MTTATKSKTEYEICNPFSTVDNSKKLMENLATIDSKDIRSKFTSAQDPINLAFDAINSMSLKTLAKDFVKESFFDIVSIVKEVCC